MLFGISPAGEIFQQRLDQAIDGLDGVRTVADDILIIGNGETLQAAVADHDKKFERCTQQKTHKLFWPDENSIKQCCAAHFVQCCQQYCSTLLHLIAG